MVSDWLKTRKKPPRTNQNNKIQENGHGFSRRRLDLIYTQNNNRKVTKIFQKPEHSKKYVFLAKCIENTVLREKYCQQNRGKWARETKKQATYTDYAKVKKIKNKNGCSNPQTMTATPFRHLNEQGYKFSMITTGISSHVRYLLEEKGVRLLSLNLLWSEDLYYLY